MDRCKQYVLGGKPGLLKHVRHLDKKVWKQYQAHLSRTTPLDRAAFYAREMKERRVGSCRALSQVLGEPVRRVDRFMRLLGLPEPIQAFLRERREPKYVRFFTETRLQEIVRISDPRAAWRRFQEMAREAEREAGVWTQDGKSS